MGRRKRAGRSPIEIEQTKQELIALAKKKHLEVEVYSDRPCHMRVFGNTTVDYWPSTTRCWIFGSKQKGRKMTPSAAIELALGPTDNWEQLAEQHLTEIKKA